MIGFIRLVIFILILFSFSTLPVYAAVQWSLSVVEGLYYPGLNDLNRTLTHANVELGPRKTDARPISYPVVYQGPSPVMPTMNPMAPQFGLQLQADLDPQYALIFGGSMATLESKTRDIRKFFVGFNIDSPRETRFALSVNQVWVGVRRNFEIGRGTVEMPPKRIYGEVGLIGITSVTLTTDVWLHVYSPEEGFDFYKVTSTGSQGRGYATYLGTGGEFFLKKWLSLGVDVQYVFGGIKYLRFNRFFTVDPLEQGLIKVGDKVTMTDLDRGSRRPIFLSLDGWDLKGMVKVYF